MVQSSDIAPVAGTSFDLALLNAEFQSRTETEGHIHVHYWAETAISGELNFSFPAVRNLDDQERIAAELQRLEACFQRDNAMPPLPTSIADHLFEMARLLGKEQLAIRYCCRS